MNLIRCEHVCMNKHAYIMFACHITLKNTCKCVLCPFSHLCFPAPTHGAPMGHLWTSPSAHLNGGPRTLKTMKLTFHLCLRICDIIICDGTLPNRNLHFNLLRHEHFFLYCYHFKSRGKCSITATKMI